jgi:hypothetical protein
MSSILEVTNLDRYDEYRLVLNRKDSVEVFPLKSVTAEILPGEYDLSFRRVSEEEIPSTCKPIRIVIQDGKALSLQVMTQNLAIKIFDGEGNHLNGRYGFLCGKLADGVYCENPIA